jgi:HK97 family phage major capsid protein
MSWKKIKALNEQRYALGQEAREMIAKAESEKRALNADEDKKFGDLQKRGLEMQSEVARLEQTRGVGGCPIPREAIGAPDGLQNAFRSAGPQNDDSAETRSLARDESCTDFLAKRGVGQSASGVSFGQYIRSIAVGPRSAEERSLLQSTGSAGGYTVPTDLSAQWADALRPASVVMQAGAGFAPLLSNLNYIARVDTPPSASWIAEMDDVPTSDAVFGRIQLIPKDVVCRCTVSRSLLQDSINIESVLQSVLVKAVAQEIDRAAMFGSGASNQPTGIFGTSGIGSVSMGTNGAALTSYGPLQDAVYELTSNNSQPPTAAIMAPRTGLAIDKLTDTLGQPLNRPRSLESLPFLQTTAVPITQTQGTSSVASSVIVGDFSQLIVGVRLSPTIEMTQPPLHGEKLAISFLVWSRIDIAVAHAKSFAKLIGITP